MHVICPLTQSLRSARDASAFRLRSVCVPSAFRLRSVCVPSAFRLRSVCVCVYYELAFTRTYYTMLLYVICTDCINVRLYRVQTVYTVLIILNAFCHHLTVVAESHHLVMIIGSKLLPIIMSKIWGASRFILPILNKTGARAPRALHTGRP